MIHRTTLAAMASIALTLAGCGGGSKPADDAREQASPQVSPETTRMPDGNCTRQIPVAIPPAASYAMKWNAGRARGEGEDPHAVFSFPPVSRMCGIRVRFTVVTRDAKPPFFQVFWASTGQPFSEAGGSWGATLDSSSREQTILVRGCSPPSPTCADRDIAQIRIDPATGPVDFQLAEMTVLAE